MRFALLWPLYISVDLLIFSLQKFSASLLTSFIMTARCEDGMTRLSTRSLLLVHFVVLAFWWVLVTLTFDLINLETVSWVTCDVDNLHAHRICIFYAILLFIHKLRRKLESDVLLTLWNLEQLWTFIAMCCILRQIYVACFRLFFVLALCSLATFCP